MNNRDTHHADQGVTTEILTTQTKEKPNIREGYSSRRSRNNDRDTHHADQGITKCLTRIYWQHRPRNN